MNFDSGILKNDLCILSVEKRGGCIVDFQLKDSGINPLNFNMKQEGKYHEDFYYKGHFICLGRWGDPSPGEMRRGLNKHGEFLRLNWDLKRQNNQLEMSILSKMEGLSILRSVELSETAACYKVTEEIRNHNYLGRLYQMVQHATIAQPFLNELTQVDCNGVRGFDYAFKKYDENVFGGWPDLKTADGQVLNVSRPNRPYSSVFPFVVEPADRHGWITAYSPEHHLLLGYIWERKDYPWINHWIHWEETSSGEGRKELKYRGMEFGNTGIHKPFPEILSQDLLHILGENSAEYIDSGEKHVRSFYSFLIRTPEDFASVERVEMDEGKIILKEKDSGRESIIQHHIN